MYAIKELCNGDTKGLKRAGKVDGSWRVRATALGVGRVVESDVLISR